MLIKLVYSLWDKSSPINCLKKPQNIYALPLIQQLKKDKYHKN